MLTFTEFQKHFGTSIVGGSDTSLMRESMAVDDHAEKANHWAERAEKQAARGSRGVAMAMTAASANKALREKLVTRSNVRQVFRSFDTDRSGKITIEEFRKMISQWGIVLSDQEFTKFTASFPCLRDKTITFSEFQAEFGEDIKRGGAQGGVFFGQQEKSPKHESRSSVFGLAVANKASARNILAVLGCGARCR